MCRNIYQKMIVTVEYFNVDIDREIIALLAIS